jgi:hypothetical protein
MEMQASLRMETSLPHHMSSSPSYITVRHLCPAAVQPAALPNHQVVTRIMHETLLCVDALPGAQDTSNRVDPCLDASNREGKAPGQISGLPHLHDANFS